MPGYYYNQSTLNDFFPQCVKCEAVTRKRLLCFRTLELPQIRADAQDAPAMRPSVKLTRIVFVQCIQELWRRIHSKITYQQKNVKLVKTGRMLDQITDRFTLVLCVQYSVKFTPRLPSLGLVLALLAITLQLTEFVYLMQMLTRSANSILLLMQGLSITISQRQALEAVLAKSQLSDLILTITSITKQLLVVKFIKTLNNARLLQTSASCNSTMLDLQFVSFSSTQ